MTRELAIRAALAVALLAAVPSAPAPAAAETVAERFAAGVAAFKAGEYEQAATAFGDLARKYRVASPDVQVDLGAAQFEAGRPGPAIAAFHRAIRLDPSGPAADTARVNLARVRNVLSQQAGHPAAGKAFVFGAYADAWTALAGWASPAVALAVFLGAWTLFFASLGVWRLLAAGRWRFAVGTAAVAFGIATAATGLLAWGSAHVDTYRIGVVVQDDAGLLDDIAATEPALSLPQGLEVRVLASRGSWDHVRLSSGREGWLSREDLDIP